MSPKPARQRQGPPSWPEDPVEEAKLHYVSDYLMRGFTPQQIGQALAHHYPGQTFSTHQVWQLTDRLERIWRAESGKKGEVVFGEIEAKLRHVADQAINLFHESKTDHYREVAGPNGEPMRLLVKGANASERAQMLAVATRALSAMSQHRFGNKGGGVIVNVDNRHANVRISKDAEANLELRDQAERIRAMIYDGSARDEAPTDAIDAEFAEVEPTSADSLQDELVQIAVSRGAAGRTVRGEEDDDGLLH